MLAIQTAIGEVGGKAATALTQSYTSMIAFGNFQYGANASGIFLLNQGTSTPSFSLFDCDIGTPKDKRFEYIYVTLDSAISTVVTLTVLTDNGVSYPYTVTTALAGVQRLRFKIGRGIKGRVWRVSLSSPAWFEIHQIDALFVPLTI
jgi:hypothetical protein